MSEVKQDFLQWKEEVLSDVADVQTGPFGSQLKNEQYIIGGTPVVAFFQAVKARLVKFESTGSGRSNEELETTIR